MLLSFVGNIFSMSNNTSKIYVSTADSADSKTVPALAGAACTVGTIIVDKGSSITREVTDFIAQNKVGFCVAAGTAVIGSGMYAYEKYKQRTAAAEASRRQLELEEAETEAQIQADLVLQQALRDVAISEAETEAQIQEGLEMQEAWQDIRKALG